MPARFLKETEIQEAILTEIKQEVEVIKAAHGVVPGPVIIFVGSNPVSLSYVSLKINPARSHGEESARQLQRWLVESDVATDPQAFIISPESSIELARVIVASDSHYHAGVAVARTAVELLRGAYDQGKLRI